LDFCIFNENNEALINEEIVIKKFRHKFEIWEDEKRIFKVKDKIELDWLSSKIFGFNSSEKLF